MPLYRVSITFTVDADATTPDDAAEGALLLFDCPDTLAPLVRVVELRTALATADARDHAAGDHALDCATRIHRENACDCVTKLEAQ